MEQKAQDANLFEVLRVGGIATALVVLVATYLLVRFVTSALHGVGMRWVDKRLLINQVATLTRFVIWIVGLAIAVALSVNLTREALLAIGGTAAVTIGFALKDLAASILAGVIIIIDRPFQVGDRVSFGSVYGEIAAIGLRSVRLVTLDDNVVTIPNNKFLTDVVSSGNWGALEMMIEMDFFVGIDQDIALAERLVGEALTSCSYAYTKKPWVVLVNQVLQDNVMAIRLRAKAYVLDVQYEKAFESEVTRRVMTAFRTHRVLPPALLHRQVDGAGERKVTAEPS
jgi:small-conductance mechanosensitive channel